MKKYIRTDAAEKAQAKVAGRTVRELRAHARRIYRAADAGGTIQAQDMLSLTDQPALHTTMSLRAALFWCRVNAAKVGPEYD